MKQFIKIEKSDRPLKKFVFLYKDDKGITKTIHFGSKNSNTYLDHHDKTKRDNYLKRHAALSENWNKINAGSLSRYLLWGKSINLYDNLINYLNKFNILHDFSNENNDY
jgi:hypothetical protein